MPVLDIDAHFAVAECDELRFIRRMNGSAQSLMVGDAADQLWILKPKSNLQGANTLANELVGSELCRALGIPTPDYKIFNVNSTFCDDPRVWLDGPAGGCQVLKGLHFGSRYLPDALGREVYEMGLPTASSEISNLADCLAIVLFDIWAMHGDSRQVLFHDDGNSFCATFFDHSHLFGGPDGLWSQPFLDGRFIQQAALHIFRTTDLYETMIIAMKRTIPQALERAFRLMPIGWYYGNYQTLSSILLHRLDNITSLIADSFKELSIRQKQRSCIGEPMPSRHFQRLLRDGRIH